MAQDGENVKMKYGTDYDVYKRELKINLEASDVFKKSAG